MHGKLIVLEGTDGAGKSTQVKLIQKYLDSKNLKSAFIHFPIYDDNEFSEIIAAFLRGEYGNIDKVDPYFVANIYAMNRFLFKPKLHKLLLENDVVILDRYVYSNAAFQAAKYSFDSLNEVTNETRNAYNIIEWILDFEFNFLKLHRPDLTIFFDVPINTVEKRLSEQREGDDRDYLKGKQDIHEADMKFQSRVRDIYLSLQTNDYNSLWPYQIVDCEVMGELLTPTELFYSYKSFIDKTIRKDGI